MERVQVAELLGDAILASHRYFRHYTQGLFDDSRVRIIEEDGRHHLSATDETYDVIVGDLFVPWKAGNGGLYTLEHFRNVSERLADGGLFAQWIPLYQISERELGIIARTFTEVFPDAMMWIDPVTAQVMMTLRLLAMMCLLSRFVPPCACAPRGP